jgi:endoglucanase
MVNIGNMLENTSQWEVGWGNPRITKEYIGSLAALGFKTVRLPVAWDTYAREGRIQPDKLARVGEVVDWITAAGMFCIVNIHWDGGWIDSSYKARFPDTYATFSAEAERKYRSYWKQMRTTGGNNGKRLLIVTGYFTDIGKTTSSEYVLPTDTVLHRLFISVHYYTPWKFVGMTEDGSWGKMQPTWGSPSTGGDISRQPPYSPSPALRQLMQSLYGPAP